MDAIFHELIEEIETCRSEMVRLASGTTLSHHQVIETSQKLDYLLNEFAQYKK